MSLTARRPSRVFLSAALLGVFLLGDAAAALAQPAPTPEPPVCATLRQQRRDLRVQRNAMRQQVDQLTSQLDGLIADWGRADNRVRQNAAHQTFVNENRAVQQRNDQIRRLESSLQIADNLGGANSRIYESQIDQLQRRPITFTEVSGSVAQPPAVAQITQQIEDLDDEIRRNRRQARRKLERLRDPATGCWEGRR